MNIWRVCALIVFAFRSITVLPAQPKPDTTHALKSGAAHAALVGNSQDDSRGVRVPLLGYVASGSPVRLHPIVGSPGAVLLGGPIALPDDVSGIWFAPAQRYVFIQRDGAD